MNIFERIYRRNIWNGVETRSGPGSGPAATERIRVAIRDMVAELGVLSVLDVACGEGYWQPDLPGYVGMDVAPDAIRMARRLHPNRDYRVHDARIDCPRADLVICRDAIQHLSFVDGLAVLTAIRTSGSKWLLASTYTNTENVDINTGHYYEPDLEAAPFNLWPAERLIPDGYDYFDPNLIRDPRKFLGLWRLQA